MLGFSFSPHVSGLTFVVPPIKDWGLASKIINFESLPRECMKVVS